MAGPRYMLVSGAEYLLLGILLGPQVSGVLHASALDAFAPFMTLALGWIGAVVGSNFLVPRLVRTRPELLRVAFTEATLTLVVTAALLTAALAWLYRLPLGDTVPPAAALGAIASRRRPPASRCSHADSSGAGSSYARSRSRRASTHSRRSSPTVCLLCIEHGAPVPASRTDADGMGRDQRRDRLHRRLAVSSLRRQRARNRSAVHSDCRSGHPRERRRRVSTDVATASDHAPRRDAREHPAQPR